jgi:hypothetical protein
MLEQQNMIYAVYYMQDLPYENHISFLGTFLLTSEEVAALIKSSNMHDKLQFIISDIHPHERVDDFSKVNYENSYVFVKLESETKDWLAYEYKIEEDLKHILPESTC